ncbi:hypothetical protein ACLB2K_075913 [Fragaria x ananassa]
MTSKLSVKHLNQPSHGTPTKNLHGIPWLLQLVLLFTNPARNVELSIRWSSQILAWDVSESAHFDLSGKAFSAMALPGQCQELRNAGKLEVRFARVACEYPGKTIAFHVDQGSSAYYFAVVIEYEEGDGDVASVQLKDSKGIEKWCDMQQSWGAVWKLDAGGSPLKPPLSLKVTSQYSRKTLLAENVIPTNWQPGCSYRSVVKHL